MNKVWVVEARMINTPGTPWVVADFFSVPFASSNYRDACRMRRNILRAHESWTEKELRLRKYFPGL